MSPKVLLRVLAVLPVPFTVGEPLRKQPVSRMRCKEIVGQRSVVRWFAEGRLSIVDDRVLIDGRPAVADE